MIDVHVHARPDSAFEDVARDIEVCGFSRALLAAAPLDHWGAAMNKDCARLVERFPDNLLGLVGIHPPDVDASLRAIDTYGARGFVGIKLMPTVGYYPDDERFTRIWEEVNARKWLVLQHCGWCSKGVKTPDLPQSTRFTDPYHVEPLARVYTDTDFILAHGGGRTFFPRAAELTHYHENVFIDTCPGQGTWILRHGGEWLGVLCWDRVLFGTDMVLGSDGARAAQHYAEKAYLVHSLIGYAGYLDRVPGVLHDNGARLLRKHGVHC